MKNYLMVLSALSLAACGGSSGGGSASSGDPQGFYQGTLENPAAGTNDLMWTLIDANHQAVMVDQTTGDIYRFTSFSASGDSFSGAYTSYSFSSSGLLSTTTTTTVGNGNYNSSFVPQSTISGYLASSSTSTPVYSFDGTYEQAQYVLAASFSTIAGSYSFKNGSTSVSLDVTDTGSLTLSYTGCTGSGSITIPDTAYNAYELSGSLNCSGAIQNITGLASFTPAAGSTAAELTLEYDNGTSLAVQAVAKQ